LALLALVALVPGCGESSSGSASSTQSFPATPRTVFGGDRPVTLQVPTTYDAGHPTPLLVVVHAYGVNGSLQEQYLRLGKLVESEGILIVAPDGTVDASGSHFWNATDACCNFDGSTVDDVGYIRGLIADIRHDYNVDWRRIYLVGHSNGGFMAHRLACDAAQDIAAIVSLAGATFLNAADCRPSEPVNVLDIHGDADTDVLYGGGDIGDPYPGELETMAHWQVYDRCAPGLVPDPTTLNLDILLPGNETTIQRFDGCARGTDVELWTIHGGAHIPTLSADFAPRVWQWLNDHPKA
jgi:polyhydroxybutyrate depolymerase